MARRLTVPAEVGPTLWCLVLAIAAAGPLLLHRGFALVGDMVFVPEQPWKDRWLALDGTVPRAVPSDALVSLVTQVVPGDLLQKGILVGILALGGMGMTRLSRARGWRAQCAAATLFVWNPYVYERMAIGHWALLCGYASLPWVAVAAERVREGASVRRMGNLVLALAVGAASSATGGVLGAVVAVAVVSAGRRWRAAVGTAAAALVLNLPWLLPGALVSETVPTEAGGVAEFAAVPDSPLGTIGSLVSLGGIWKESVAPPERALLLLAVLALLMALGGLVGAVRASADGDLTMTALCIAGGVGLALAWIPSNAWGRPVFEWAVSSVPGAGLLRDSHKWLALTGLVVAAGFGAAVSRFEQRHGRRPGVPVALTLLVLLPVAVLPGMAWGQFGRYEPVAYPQEWSDLAAEMDQELGEEDRVVVLPFEAYRRYAWNDDRAMLDPAPRFFSGDLVTNDSLRVGDDTVVAGEDPVARRIADASDHGPGDFVETLRREAVGWVLLDKGSPGADSVPDIPGEVVHDGAELRLVRLEGPVAARPGPPAWRPLVLGVDVAVLLAVLGTLVTAVLRRGRGILRRSHWADSAE